MPLQTNFVPGDGNPETSIWGIGEAPGSTENTLLRPFVGASGRLLDIALKDAQVSRNELFLWNCFHQQPPYNDIDYFFRDSKRTILTDEGLEHIDRLAKHIQDYNPKLIIAFGAIPLFILTGKSEISRWRGSVLPCTLVEGPWVYPTFHPSFVMRMLQERKEDLRGETVVVKKGYAENLLPILVKDLQRAKEQSLRKTYERPYRVFHTNPSANEAIQFIKICQEQFYYIAVDIETLKNSAIITRVGLAPSSEEAMSIPFILNGLPCWTQTEFEDILVSLSEFLLSPTIKVFQNGFYDLSVLGYHWHLRASNNSVADTMVQHHCVHPHLRKGLDFQISVYTWEPYYKDEGKQHGIRVGDEALSIYNCRDACVTREIWPITLKECRDYGVIEGLERTISFYPMLLSMMLRGVRIDIEGKNKLIEKFTLKILEIQNELQRVAGEGFNPASNKQLQELLYSKLGLPPQINRKTGRITTDEDSLRQLDQRTNNPILKRILEFRRYSKLLGTYANVELSKDGRIRTSYDPTGTVTWRLSSYSSHLGGGGNLQNIPKRADEGGALRRLFMADPGFIMVAADYRQAEAMVVAWLARDEELKELFLSGGDVHWWTTQRIFNLGDRDFDDPEHNKFREISKVGVHADNYEVGPRTLQQHFRGYGIDFTFSECKDLLQSLRAARPFVQEWKRRVIEKIDTDRTLITPLNRKRIFYGRRGPDLYRAALAFVPQSTVGELTLLGMRNIYERLNEAQLLMNVHDEVVLQVPEKTDMESLDFRLRECMELPLTIGEETLTIPIEIKTGPNWGELK